jgi:tetratricopeptide (TPR) repeat protein
MEALVTRRRLLLSIIGLVSISSILSISAIFIQPSFIRSSRSDSGVGSSLLVAPAHKRTLNSGNAESTLLSVGSQDLRLKEWLAVRLQGAVPYDDSTSPKMMSDLREILLKTSLSCVDLFTVADAFHLVTRDGVTSAIFYQAAAVHAQSELADSVGSASQTMPILVAMKDNLKDFKRVLWPLIEDQNNSEALDTLYRIYSSMVQFDPPGENSVSKVMTHVKVGLSECLILKGQSGEAIAILGKLDPRLLNREKGELNAYDWAYGLALYRSRKYTEAIPHFKSVVAQPGFKYSANALPPLIDSLCNLDRGQEAAKYFDAFVDRYHPNLPMELQYKSEIEEATFRASRGAISAQLPRLGTPLKSTAPTSPTWDYLLWGGGSLLIFGIAWPLFLLERRRRGSGPKMIEINISKGEKENHLQKAADADQTRRIELVAKMEPGHSSPPKPQSSPVSQSSALPDSVTPESGSVEKSPDDKEYEGMYYPVAHPKQKKS